MEDEIVSLLEEKGAMTGRELYHRLRDSTFTLWKTCLKSQKIVTTSVARPYLRLDRKVPGYARLSPAPQREFLTYTVVGLEVGGVKAKAGELEEEIEKISSYKLREARDAAREAIRNSSRIFEEGAVFLIGGDVPLRMAHSDPRPERALGMMVSGSDLDVVVVTENGVEEERLGALDSALMEVKYSLLNRPVRKEELDYIVKSLATVEEQMKFESFEDRVACKILQESEYLAGNREMALRIKEMLVERGVEEELEKLEEKGRDYRDRSVALLLEEGRPSEETLLKTFTTTMEFSEIF